MGITWITVRRACDRREQALAETEERQPGENLLKDNHRRVLLRELYSWQKLQKRYDLMKIETITSKVASYLS